MMYILRKVITDVDVSQSELGWENT